MSGIQKQQGKIKNHYSVPLHYYDKILRDQGVECFIVNYQHGPFVLKFQLLGQHFRFIVLDSDILDFFDDNAHHQVELEYAVDVEACRAIIETDKRFRRDASKCLVQLTHEAQKKDEGYQNIPPQSLQRMMKHLISLQGGSIPSASSHSFSRNIMSEKDVNKVGIRNSGATLKEKLEHALLAS